MKRIFTTIAISLPVVLLILLVRMPSLGRQELSSVKCQVKKWNIPESTISKNQVLSIPESKKSPILIPRLPVTCCLDDPSCLDEFLYRSASDKKALLTAIDRSLQYLQTARAENAYKDYPVPGITRDRIFKSLTRFRQLLLTANSPAALHTAIQREFVLYQSIGKDTKGSVLFTAYYEPVYTASRVPTPEYRYPVYKIPPDLNSWTKPHPTRLQLEGADGLQGAKGKLRGLELLWFRDRLEPYMVQIEGSARIQLTNGTETTIGYAGNTAYNYSSIGRELANDGKLPLEGMTMPIILDYFRKYPQELNVYIPRDRSFVFFQENKGATAQGSINVSLTAERSIATDKSLMPPGALALIRASIPFPQDTGQMEHHIVSRYVLDQDTGGAIKGPGRVDYFLGTGKLAGDRAGVTVSNGQLFYLLLK
ncbi:murein transglycosylase A [Calothrix sp. PCC 7507]|uniref:murein transglycosylase A n=1 Tax=Calothrix sp. PCC 7507 TaxID=99598 RepID=UPI00029F2A5C|nr:murein transglycosylase A [Calothrix sp. PCC 7507]AFY30909.1 MltA domain protein [Calothrix sp. PCC 7507]